VTELSFAFPDPSHRSPSRRPDSTLGGSPQRAAELLADIRAGNYGVLCSGKVVLMEGADQVRHCPDEDLVGTLIGSGCVEPAPIRESVVRLDGAVRRTVTLLRLTHRGHSICQRWNALAPIRGTAGDGT
jgi:hypothetical protein